MEHHELLPDAEVIRKQIRQIVFEANAESSQHNEGNQLTISQDDNGNKTYMGALLTDKISRLTEIMKIGGPVCTFLQKTDGWIYN